MLDPLFARLKTALDHTLEGDLAKLPPHERREQQRRQIQLLHWPLANLLLALAVLEALHVALMAFEQLRPLLVWQGAAALGLLALAAVYRNLVSLRRRVWMGFSFLALMLACLLVPVQSWQGAPLLSLREALLHLPTVTWQSRLLSRLRLGQQELLAQIAKPPRRDDLVGILDPRGELAALAKWSEDSPGGRWRRPRAGRSTRCSASSTRRRASRSRTRRRARSARGPSSAWPTTRC